ncbi:BCCT family transporter [Oceanimonas sp. NS1]|nr:BCCT family transporter [Oceanimonas sp. NS1]
MCNRRFDCDCALDWRGLSALQAGVTATGLPFSALMLVMCYTIFQGLRSEPR